MLKSKFRQKLHIVIGIFMLTFAVLLKPLPSYALEDSEKATVESANAALEEITTQKDILAVVYLADSYDIKSEPSQTSDSVLTVKSGQSVCIIGEAVSDDYTIWAKVNAFYNEQYHTGYVLRSKLLTADQDFLTWETSNNMTKEYWDGVKASHSRTPFRLMSTMPRLMSSAPGSTPARTYSEDVMTFPESYRDGLQDLKDAHPTWCFAKLDTGLDWQTVIDNEIDGRKSMVYTTLTPACKEAFTGDTNWYFASEEALKFYMDPRNSFTENYIFQFELEGFNATYHSKEALDLFLNTTFMSNSSYAPGHTEGDNPLTYADIIWQVAQEKNISPFILASRIYQEQGSGTSPLISGTHETYPGVYNYFNVGASGNTTAEVIANGLAYATAQGWTNAYKSILGGSSLVADSYVAVGQDTLYLHKYNVNPSNPSRIYAHQYMQNISAPKSESKTVRNMYANSGTLECAFVFKIPVYNNMPDEPCAYPETGTKMFFYLPSTAAANGVGTTPHVWVDGVEKTSVTRNGYIVIDAGNNTSTNAVIYIYNSSGVCTGMYTWLLNYTGGTYVATREEALDNLLTYHGFSVRITGETGIRFKTGISIDTRAALLGAGIDGYRLSEYGTLVMKEDNRATYPFIKGGEKVASGKAYGGGTDAIFATEGGRYHFTSVLTNLPPEQYKTEYAFRGYIILTNGSRSVTIYGPPKANSIYALANRLISGNYYQAGSAPYEFLSQIIRDADALGGE